MLLEGIKRIVAFLCAITAAMSGADNAVPPQSEHVGFVKALWVSTVHNIDYPTVRTADETVLMQEADVLLDNCLAWGINTVFLQVRPACDAIYKSQIYPWSVYLTGTHGAAPGNGFDALEYFVNGAHSRGMELHAWINPYRVTSGGEDEYALLSPASPAKTHPELLLKTADGNYYFNPAFVEARELILDGISEIVSNYDVDGIHFDDYFYPNSYYDDSAQFAISGKNDLAQWRRDNVDALVSAAYKKVKSIRQSCEFGISPCGIWANKATNPLGSDTNGFSSYERIYADSRKWVEEGFVDYICPQIYWNIGFESADYKHLCDWWSAVTSAANVKLYIGLAAYKTGNPDYGSEWSDAEEIARQRAFNASASSISGESYFSYSSILKSERLQQIIKNQDVLSHVPIL
ncbi:MAG: family 10 glycosylhydrolase [Clostridia bacterium]|nr:family 10 glycosylhydrolase [Clostridia bacterium]